MSDQLLPPHTPECMGCGLNNAAGLQMQVHLTDNEVYTDIVFDSRHVGAPGLAHGGAVSAACDDLFGFTLWIARRPAVTRSLTVEYLAPVALGQTHRITAHIVKESGRAIHVAASEPVPQQPVSQHQPSSSKYPPNTSSATAGPATPPSVALLSTLSTIDNHTREM